MPVNLPFQKGSALNMRGGHLIHPLTETVNMGTKKCCRRLTGVASLVHHQHIGANANYPTDIALELPVGQPDTANWGKGLGFGARLRAVHLGPRGIDHAQVFRALLLLHAIHVTGQPILLITASLNFNVTGWKRGQGGHGLEHVHGFVMMLNVKDGQTVSVMLWHWNRWSCVLKHCDEALTRGTTGDWFSVNICDWMNLYAVNLPKANDC